MDLETFEKIAREAEADQVLIVVEEEERNLTRFANSVIHQNIDQKDQTVVVRAVKDQRVAVTVEHGVLDADHLKAVVNRAIGLCPHLPQDPDWPPAPKPQKHPAIPGFVEATYQFGPIEKGKTLEDLLGPLKKAGLTAAGYLETRIHRLTVVTKTGIAKSFRSTTAAYKVIVQTPEGSSGYQFVVGRDISALDLQAATDDAVFKAETGRTKTELPPGRYTVILEPAAVGHLLLFLAFMGFGGRSVAMGWSFFRPGKKILGENVTIVDDPLDPRNLGMPFDYEGVPKRRVVIVEHGVAKEAVYDTYWAHKAGKTSTGHALRPDNTYGPYPKNMVMTAGDTDRKALLEGLDQAIWINRLWYVNFFNPIRTQVTGMTRDGTLLVRDGKIVGGVQDMRFLVSILETFSSIERATRQLFLTQKYSAYQRVPYLVVRDFSFIA